VSRSLNLEEILDNALDEVLDVMGMDCGQALVLQQNDRTLVPVAHRGLSPDFVRLTNPLPLESSLAHVAAREGRPVVRRVAHYLDGDLRELVEREGVRLVVSVPLIAQGRAVGALNLGTRAPRSFAEDELGLLAAIGQQIGMAVENACLYDQAQELAVIKERHRLARDLHDSVTQALYGVSLYAEAASRQLASGDTGLASGHLAEIRETAQESLREMRLLIFELRPPALSQDGLVGALQARLESVEGRVGVGTELDTRIEGRLTPHVEDGLYRIAQEALNNSLRHAHASHVSVQLVQDGRLVVLSVGDDGIGFDLAHAWEQGGLGLRGMQERAERLDGRLTVLTAPGDGTRVCVEVQQ
jgi:signal transduction histidine kinase